MAGGEHYCDPNNPWNWPPTLAMLIWNSYWQDRTHDHQLMECGL